MGGGASFKIFSTIPYLSYLTPTPIHPIHPIHPTPIHPIPFTFIMCDSSTWQQQHNQAMFNIHSQTTYTGNGDVKVTGNLTNYSPGNTKLAFWAPCPPDYRTSYSGAGLPYANSEMAYQSTPNAGVVSVGLDGSFSFSIAYPSGYYSGLGTMYVSPHVQLQPIVDGKPGKVEVNKLGEGIPFRLLSYPPIPSTAPRCSPAFYGNRDTLPVRTQEQVLRDSAYPKTNAMPANFWGLAPAN